MYISRSKQHGLGAVYPSSMLNLDPRIMSKNLRLVAAPSATTANTLTPAISQTQTASQNIEVS